MATASDLGEGVSRKPNVSEIIWMIVEWVLVIYCLVKSVGSSLISGQADKPVSYKYFFIAINYS